MNANVFSQINLKLGLLLLGIEFRVVGNPENPLGARGKPRPFEIECFAFIIVKIWWGDRPPRPMVPTFLNRYGQ